MVTVFIKKSCTCFLSILKPIKDVTKVGGFEVVVHLKKFKPNKINKTLESLDKESMSHTTHPHIHLQ